MSAWAELVCFLASFFLVSLIDAILSVFLPMFFSGKNCWCLLWIELAFFLVYVFLVSSIDANLSIPFQGNAGVCFGLSSRFSCFLMSFW